MLNEEPEQEIKPEISFLADSGFLSPFILIEGSRFVGVSWRDWANTPNRLKYFVLWPGEDLYTFLFLHGVNTLLAVLFLTWYSDPQDHQKFQCWLAKKGCLPFLPDPGSPNRVYSFWLFPPALQASACYSHHHLWLQCCSLAQPTTQAGQSWRLP